MKMQRSFSSADTSICVDGTMSLHDLQAPHEMKLVDLHVGKRGRLVYPVCFAYFCFYSRLSALLP